MFIHFSDGVRLLLLEAGKCGFMLDIDVELDIELDIELDK